MKHNTTMTFNELSALRDSVNAYVANLRKGIDGWTERGRKAQAALTKELAVAATPSIPAEERERLEGIIRDLKAARTVETGSAHADGRKPVTTKLDKAIKAAEDDLSAYQAKLDAAKEAEPVLEELRSAAQSRHADEMKTISANVATIKRGIAEQERLLAIGAMEYACHAALAAATDEMVADRLQGPGDRQSKTAAWMEEMFKGSAFAHLERQFEKTSVTRLRDAELTRLAAAGLEVPKPFDIRSIPFANARIVMAPQQGIQVTQSEPTEAQELRYMHAGVFNAAGQRISN